MSDLTHLKIYPYIIFISTLIAICHMSVNRVSADVFGRFDIGSYSFFPDDESFDNRTSIAVKLKYQWSESTNHNWSFLSDIKLRGEPGGEKGEHLQIVDFRLNYGMGVKPIGSSIGISRITDIAGIGSIAGIYLRTNFHDTYYFGLAGGANPRILKGITDFDGSKYCLYGKYKRKNHDIGIAYIMIDDTDLARDETDRIIFETHHEFKDSFFVNQNGEVVLDSGANDSRSLLRFYYGSMQWDLNEQLKISLIYEHNDTEPYLTWNPEDGTYLTGFDAETRLRDDSFKSNSVSPRIEYRFNATWRGFIRYRYRSQDFREKISQHQTMGGFSCANLFNSGISCFGMVIITQSDRKNYKSGFFTLSKSIGSMLTLTLNYSADRFRYPESFFDAPYMDTTHRFGVSAFYRFTKSITGILEYERTLGSDDQDRDHRMFVNFQYRF
ncbi:hypothetical protein JW979_01080 [bacterium]|nr:hypothetical protein [candidate division CSSED10-310 bacterium]